MSALYNEIVPHAAEWLRNLAAAGHIAPGRVDERSVADLAVEDVRGAVQFHTFAGIGVWSHALRLVGWPDDVPVWTGSCPCQPFSQAGDRAGFGDPRHLWPAWFKLIAGARPPVVFGEQVASKDGLAWLDVVLADLEGEGYAVRAFDLCAAGVGAPHIRQRLYFVALADDDDDEGWGVVRRARLSRDGDTSRWYDADGRGADGLVGDARGARGGRDGGALPRAEGSARRGVRGEPDVAVAASDAGTVADDDDARLKKAGHPTPRGQPELAVPGPVNGFWRHAEWLACTDGKSRPVEPGTFPLVDGLAGRVALLRAYGNAIVAPLATEFIGAVMDSV